jgi:hypothetical protein
MKNLINEKKDSPGKENYVKTLIENKLKAFKGNSFNSFYG